MSTRTPAETCRFAAAVVGEANIQAPVVRDLTLVTNGNDRTIDENAALSLLDSWAVCAEAIDLRFRFDPILALPHDLIDVSQRCGMPDVVYPVLIGLMEKHPVTPAGATPARCGVPAATRASDGAAPRR